MKTKKIFIAMSAIIIAALTSCSSDENSIDSYDNGQKITFTGSLVESKTSISVDGEGKGNVLWSEGDKIGVFAGTSSNAEFSITSGTGKGPGFESADFNGTINGYTPGTTAYAYYPYKSDVSMSGTVISGIELPQTQTYKENTFDTNVAPAAATSTNLLLPFKNLCGIIKIQLTGSTSISTITFSGGDKYVAGTGSVDIANISAGFVPDAAQYKTVTLQCPTPVALSATPTIFYILVPPQTYNGITLVITDSEGKVMTKTSDNTLVVNRSTIKSLGTIDVKTLDYITVPNTTNWNVASAPKIYKYTDGKYYGLIDMTSVSGVDSSKFKFYEKTGNKWYGGTINGKTGLTVSSIGGDFNFGRNSYYYYFRGVSLNDGTTTCQYAAFSSLRIVGGFNEWSGDSMVVMNYNAESNSFSAEIEFPIGKLEFLICPDGDYERKFAGSISDVSYTTGANFNAPEAGKYKVSILFNEIPLKVTLTKIN